jgi:UPF0755 protein
MRAVKLLIFLIIPIAVALGTYAFLRQSFSLPLRPWDQSSTLFEAENQKSLRSIARELKRQGLIRHDWAFVLMAQLKKKDTAIKAGEYELSASMSPEQILDKMVKGEMFLRQVTIREGTALKEIGPLLESAGIVTLDEFSRLVTDEALLKQFRITGKDAEGYLFPETYRFPRKTPPEQVVSKMLSEFSQRWTPEFEEKAKELKLSRHQIVTLASIIEKESGNFDEQPVISSVFHNRLKRGMRLQADPTVIYGIENFDGNITKEHLLTPTPYNTYVIDGLPPGPIANPGLSALRAALFPTPSEFIYFVADGTGRHIFSATLEEHNRAVNQYQRGGR